MHLTDEQLNEYLDNETNDRIQIELHLSSCAECAARLTALQSLFSEIESLSDLDLSAEFAFRFVPDTSPSVQLPRSLTLALTLQTMLAVVGIIIVAPFVMQFLSPYVSGIAAPPFAALFLQLQNQWVTWLDLLATFPPPRIPPFPGLELSSLFLMLTLIGVFLLWLIGNGLLLRNQTK
jgi:anti-sigma factor RsiW